MALYGITDVHRHWCGLVPGREHAIAVTTNAESLSIST